MPPSFASSDPATDGGTASRERPGEPGEHEMRESPSVDVASLGARAVLDLQRRSRLLGSVWSGQPAVVAWLRHFG